MTIYSDIYVEYVSKNPLCKFDSGYITNELFKIKLDEYLKEFTK